MTDPDGETNEQTPEFAEEANSMLSQGEQAYRLAVSYLRSVRGKEVAADEIARVVDRLTGAMDRSQIEMISRLVDLLNARARSAKLDPAGVRLTAASVLTVSADIVGTIDDLAIRKSEVEHVEEMNELVARAARYGFLDLSLSQVLAVVLVVLLSVGLPLAQVQLPTEIQSVMADEEATLGIGLAITLAIMQNRKK